MADKSVVLYASDGTPVAVVYKDVGGGLYAAASVPVGTSGNPPAVVAAADGFSNNFFAELVQTYALKFNGATWDRARTPNVFKVVALAAATAEAAIWTPASGKKFRLMGFLLTPGAASTLTFKDGTGLATIFAARAGTDAPISPSGLGNGILSGAADRVLTVTRGTSATLDGVVWGCEE